MTSISRRKALFTGAEAILGVTAALVPGAIDQLQAADRQAPARSKSSRTGGSRSVEWWMDKWMKAAQAPGGTLHMSRFKDPMYFITKAGVGWKPNDNQKSYEAVEVPVGFVTDFASIPRAFWSLLRPDGEYTYPAIIHDWMYWNQDKPRADADEIIKFGMQDFGIEWPTVQTIHRAVRAAGSFAWDSNARLKAAGEKRILKKYPDSPIITWAQWKQRPDVF